MHSDIIYEERLLAKGFILIFTPIAAIMLIILMYAILGEPVDDIPALPLLFLFMFLLFLGLAINFRRLNIIITPSTITVGFGIIKKKIPLENVSDCNPDEVSAIRYGGFGIRMARVNGKKRLVYNTIGTPRCVLSLKQGKFRDFVFSTKNPEEVINVVKNELRLLK